MHETKSTWVDFLPKDDAWAIVHVLEKNYETHFPVIQQQHNYWKRDGKVDEDVVVKSQSTFYGAHSKKKKKKKMLSIGFCYVDML